MTDTCSFGTIVDALIAVTAMADYTAVYAGVEVADGPWVEAAMPPELVLVGIAQDGNAESGGTQMPRTMGAGGYGAIQEDYGIECQIVVWSGNADRAAQKKVRDRALALFAPFELEVRKNLLPNAANRSGQEPELWIERVGVTQAFDDEEYGRMAQLQFTVHVRNQLIP